jgi:hypothetical protein
MLLYRQASVHTSQITVVGVANLLVETLMSRLLLYEDYCEGLMICEV